MMQLLAIVPALALSAQPSSSVALWGKAVPTKVRLGDVIFIEVSARNDGDSPVTIPATCSLETGTLSVEIADREQSTTFRFVPDGVPIGVDASEVVLEPKQSHVLGLFMLRLPRLDWTEWRFWDPQRWPEGDYYFDLRCDGLAGRSERIFIERRRKNEMKALLELYGEGVHAPAPPKWDIDRPTLGVFGLLSFPIACSTPEKLAALEEALSPGSLRECVHVTRLTARVYDASDLAAKHARMVELVTWIDSRPELQRAYFYTRLANWSRNCSGLGEFMFEFSNRVIERVPEKYVGSDYLKNYREEMRRNKEYFEESESHN